MNKKITFEQYLNQQFAPQTAKSYNYTINHFLETNPKAKRYKYREVVSYMAEIKEKYSNTQSRIRILSAVKRYYAYLVETGQRNDHPCQTLTLKKGSNQSIQFQSLFTSEELEALMQRPNRYKHLDTRNKVIISLLIYQGLSSDELTRLDINNVDLDNGTVYIKGSHKLNRRTLNLKSNQIRLFMQYINEVRPSMLMCKTERLIINKLGKPITVDGVNAMIEPLGVLYPDRTLNPRSIRMSVIANWINEKNQSLEAVQELAGHKWPSSTEKYFKVDNLKQRELINRYFPI